MEITDNTLPRWRNARSVCVCVSMVADTFRALDFRIDGDIYMWHTRALSTRVRVHWRLRHVAHFAHSTFVSTLADEKRRVYISGGEKNWL